MQEREQPVEQPDVGAGAHGQVQVGELAGRRAARIDDDDLHVRPLPGGQPRCAGTGSDGTTRCSSRPARRDRRARGRRSRPAPDPRRRRACGRLRPMTCTGGSSYRCSRCRCSPSSACWRRSSPPSATGRRHTSATASGPSRSMMRRKPCATWSSAASQARALAADVGMQQPAAPVERFAERGAFGAQLAEVGRVIGIAADLERAIVARLREYAAADSAVGTGRANCARCHFPDMIVRKLRSRNRVARCSMFAAPTHPRRSMQATVPRPESATCKLFLALLRGAGARTVIAHQTGAELDGSPVALADSKSQLSILERLFRHSPTGASKSRNIGDRRWPRM